MTARPGGASGAVQGEQQRTGRPSLLPTDRRRRRPSTYEHSATPTANPPDTPDPGPLRRNRPFWLFWTGETISLFGTEVTSLLISLLAVVSLDASPLWVGVINASLWLPWVLIGLPTGAWVDQRPPRSVMIASDLAAALALLSIPVAWAFETLSTPQLALVTFAIGTTNVFFRAAYPKLVATLVRKDDLAPANSYLSGSESVAQVGGPPLGGALAGLLAPAVGILVDACSYVVSAVFLASARPRTPTAPAVAGTVAASETLGERIATGWRFTFADRFLRYFTLQGAVSNIGLTGFQTLLVLVLVREMGLTGPQAGLAVAVQGLGTLVGALMAPLLGRRLGSARATMLLFCGAGVGACLLPLAAPGWRGAAMLAGTFLIGACVVCANVIRGAWRQSYVPLQLMARTSTAAQTVNFSLMPVAAVGAGWLGERVGLIPAVAAMAVIVAAVSLTAPFSPLRGHRNLPEHPHRDVLLAARVPPPAWEDLR